MRSPLILESEPIAGLATPPGTAALAVIRLSGAGLMKRLLPLLRRPDRRPATLDDLVPRLLQRMDLVDSREHGSAMPLDKAMVVYFPAPRSYTGEEMAEIHCHGSPVVVRHVLDHLAGVGIRPARPGEFTRRACLNGKMDLTQAEALASLIHAATLRSAQEAMRQMEGSLSRRLGLARAKLLEILAHLEASLDFADGEDITALPVQALLMELSGVTESLGVLLRSAHLGVHLNEGFQLFIAGRPNVGKSSLFNRLLGKQRAIVSAQPGTTRDCIESRLEMHGIAVLLIDTAGLRVAEGEVEAVGIQWTRERLAQADGVLLVMDASQGVSEEDLELARSIPPGQGVVVWNKMDLFRGDPQGLPDLNAMSAVMVSCLTGAGFGALTNAIVRMFLPLPVDGEGAVIMAVRQREALVQAVRSLVECEALILHGRPSEVTAVSLRAALEALGELVGHVTHEVLLEQIFSTFCIGK
ncbi:MAG: tRNA uridine-5-carboxymethylaminomethyl(34) synthesis GTPase MnmE [Magnetococcales bacterium]|nr:tRNA uridine-5-carboxymethylaminomethyl(34) synthesis GTPase MnmE [Magnetococcales bacterium]